MQDNDSFRKYAQPGFVSAWVGDFRSEDDFDDYLRVAFPKDFGFAIPDRAVREMNVVAGPVKIEKLVEPFSRSKTFGPQISEIAESQGVGNATCMLIIYNFKYEELKPTRHSRIKYIGCVSYPGFG